MRISDWSSDVCSSDLVADRRFQADRLLGDLHHLADLLKRHRQTLGQFLRRRFAADLVKDLAAGADQLVDRLDHVDRNADGPRLIGDGAVLVAVKRQKVAALFYRKAKPPRPGDETQVVRSEEHTSEIQSLMRTS